MKNYEMSRGLNQALYKYLPDSWIDFYLSKERKNLTAKVSHWNSEKLEDVNISRLLKSVDKAVNSFRKRGHGIRGFGKNINSDNFDVLIPKRGKNVGIEAEVNPLTFFCSKCYSVYSYKESEDFLNNKKKQICKNCKVSLKQLRLVYACECGWAGPVKNSYCKNHRYNYMKYIPGKYKFKCGACNYEAQMRIRCGECEKTLYPKNALAWEIYIPFSINLIDLVDTKAEKFLSDNRYGPEMIIANRLNKINDEDLTHYMNEGIELLSNEERENKIRESKEELMKSGLPEEYAEIAAEKQVDKTYGDKHVTDASRLVREKFDNNSKENLMEIAESILEYKTILNAKDQSTLEDAIKMAKTLNTNANPEMYKKTAKEFGIKYSQASGAVPFVSVSYGYTRKKTEGSDVNLRGFTQEKESKKNVYANKLETEGILFEFDRIRIIQWLIKNQFISDDDLPVSNDSIDIKIWFMNNIDIELINPFTELDKEENAVTYYVYNLIHSISHAFIKQASHLCGLDKNSLSEYIFPDIPAIFVYCHNTQGFNLGALFNLFEAYFEKWLSSTLIEIEKCIFDPVCIEKNQSCSGCLFLNEISCCNFNKNLDRSLLIGRYDRNNKKRIYGFWEDI